MVRRGAITEKSGDWDWPADLTGHPNHVQIQGFHQSSSPIPDQWPSLPLVECKINHRSGCLNQPLFIRQYRLLIESLLKGSGLDHELALVSFGADLLTNFLSLAPDSSSSNPHHQHDFSREGFRIGEGKYFPHPFPLDLMLLMHLQDACHQNWNQQTISYLELQCTYIARQTARLQQVQHKPSPDLISSI